jgi:hypothetical protein
MPGAFCLFASLASALSAVARALFFYRLDCAVVSRGPAVADALRTE